MKAGQKSSSLEDALAHIREKLTPVSETPGLDARVLASHICGKDKSWILAHPDYELSPDETARLEQCLADLLEGMRLPYILGEWEFFGRRFWVTPDVLIPRPETELLVETALHWLQANPERRSAAEVGVGSGCISASLVAEISDLQITATDLSPQAAALAQENIERFGVQDQVSIHVGDLLTDHSGPFDLIVANLPYIPTATLKKLPVYRREPTLALDGGPEGLNLITRLLAQSVERIKEGGLILLEIESGQGDSALELAYRYFPPAASHIKPDLARHPRLLVVQT